MTPLSKSNTEPAETCEQDSPQAKLLRRFLRLTCVNMCLLLGWYLLYAEHHGIQWNDGVREFSGFYKVFLIVMTIVTLAVWAYLAQALWRRWRLA